MTVRMITPRAMNENQTDGTPDGSLKVRSV